MAPLPAGRPFRRINSSMNGINRVKKWFRARGWKPFPFQEEAWEAFAQGKSGLIHTSTGTGKTYAALLGLLIEEMNDAGYKKRLKETEEADKKPVPRGKKRPPDISPPVQLLWITPLRALANDTLKSITAATSELCPHFSVELRTGDTIQSARKRQAEKLPTIFITTPESLSLMISYPGFAERISTLKAVVVDEWHELIGSKRGAYRAWTRENKIDQT